LFFQLSRSAAPTPRDGVLMPRKKKQPVAKKPRILVHDLTRYGGVLSHGYSPGMIAALQTRGLVLSGSHAFCVSADGDEEAVVRSYVRDYLLGRLGGIGVSPDSLVFLPPGKSMLSSLLDSPLASAVRRGMQIRPYDPLEPALGEWRDGNPAADVFAPDPFTAIQWGDKASFALLLERSGWGAMLPESVDNDRLCLTAEDAYGRTRRLLDSGHLVVKVLSDTSAASGEGGDTWTLADPASVSLKGVKFLTEAAFHKAVSKWREGRLQDGVHPYRVEVWHVGALPFSVTWTIHEGRVGFKGLTVQEEAPTKDGCLANKGNITSRRFENVVPWQWCVENTLTAKAVADAIRLFVRRTERTVLRKMRETGISKGSVNLDGIIWLDAGGLKSGWTDPNIRDGGSLFTRSHGHGEVRRVNGGRVAPHDRVVGNFYLHVPSSVSFSECVQRLEEVSEFSEPISHPINGSLHPWAMLGMPLGPQQAEMIMVIPSAPDMRSYTDLRQQVEQALRF